MERIAAACQFGIKRIFQVDRHSSLMLANAFECLLSPNGPTDNHVDSVQTLQDGSTQQPLEEDTE